MNRTKKFFGNVKKNKFAYVLIAPNLLFFILFLIIPIFWIIIFSFQEGGILGARTFVGFKNYINIISNSTFIISILNTLKYLLIIIPSVFIFPMIIALILNSIKRFRNVFRAIIFIPMLSSIVVSSIIWRYMVYPDYGPLNLILGFFHIASPNWFGDSSTVLFTIAMIELWRGAPFYTVTFLAGIQSVPKEMIEASYIDGANYFQTLFKVILPNMKPILTFCLVMATIWNFQIFDPIYVLTKGGPAESSATMVWYIYQNIFFYGKVGKGATMSVILIILIAIVTIINLKITKFHKQSL